MGSKLGKLGKQTSPGFGDPNALVSVRRAGSQRPPATAFLGAAPVIPVGRQPELAPTVNSSLSPGGAPMATRPQILKSGPMVEVEVSYERGPAPRTPLGRALEIWTQNSIYVLDSRLLCIEVLDPGTREPIAEHPFVNTRLVGGQWQSEAGVELSYPLPRRGSCAVFEGRRGNKRRFSRTSVVERVVLHLQVVEVTGAGDLPSWAELVED